MVLISLIFINHCLFLHYFSREAPVTIELQQVFIKLDRIWQELTDALNYHTDTIQKWYLEAAISKNKEAELNSQS